jgi:hypothetical protein
MTTMSKNPRSMAASHRAERLTLSQIKQGT